VAEFSSLIFRSRLAALGADPTRVPGITFAMVGAPSAVHGTIFVPSMLTGLRESLCTALRRAGLAGPEVHVEAVTSLPRHPETGKLRRVIRAWTPSLPKRRKVTQVVNFLVGSAGPPSGYSPSSS
jgi:hypothetical protein